MIPFLTFYTPTYNRPQALARCMASVRMQTAIAAIEHVVIPDYVGRGVGGMYAQVPQYAAATHGEYVHFLADDDVLASSTVVEDLQRIVRGYADPPPVVIVKVRKGAEWPAYQDGPPIEGQIDLGCFVVRGDVWRMHASRGAYGQRYEGDFDFAAALWAGGVPFAYHAELLFLIGEVRRGEPEL